MRSLRACLALQFDQMLPDTTMSLRTVVSGKRVTEMHIAVSMLTVPVAHQHDTPACHKQHKQPLRIATSAHADHSDSSSRHNWGQ